jgi:hypothetical protein
MIRLPELLHLAAGVALALAAWLVPRHIAGARLAAPPVLLLDAAPIVLGAGLLLLASGRPIFAGVVALALAAGFALADYTMRQTLREPMVFSEAVELPQVFTHPHLYLPFAGPGLVLGGAAAAIAVAAAMLILEPPLSPPQPFAAMVTAALTAAGFWLFARKPLLSAAATALRRLRPTGEPFEDAAALGPFAMLFAHTVIARDERPERQAALAVITDQERPSGARLTAASPEPMNMVLRDMDTGFAAARRFGTTRKEAIPIILVQCESFFDVRRLSPAMLQLPGFDACRASGLSGRLEVPGWGANTMRTEFAVLTGISESALGYDRFNPYYGLARVPIESQVWRLRRAGYRTICLHPFDRRFFRRDLAMPALGFERFLGRETLGGGRRPPYQSDPELAGHILRMLEKEGPETFIFAITMGNHGPWLPEGPAIDPQLAELLGADAIPGGPGLLRYLDGLRRSDEMLQVLLDGLRRRGGPVVLGFYGDHLPSLGDAFAHFGFAEASSDYAVWQLGAAPQRRDIPSHELGRIIVDSRLEAAGTVARGACLAQTLPASSPR